MVIPNRPSSLLPAFAFLTSAFIHSGPLQATDGLLDSTFGNLGSTTLAIDNGDSNRDIARAVARQGDAILVAGSVRHSSYQFDAAIARFLPDGTLDTTFGTDGVEIIYGPSTIYAMAVQPDGRIVVAGHGGDYAWVERRLVDGAWDTSCGGYGYCTYSVSIGDLGSTLFQGVAVQPGGRIIVAGRTAISGNVDMLVIGLDPANFDPDPDFGVGGDVYLAFDLGGGLFDTAQAVAVTPTGRIVVAGFAEKDSPDSDFAVAVLEPDGDPDTTFSFDGRRTIAFDLGGTKSDEATSLVVQPDGKIVLGGTVQKQLIDNDFGLARLHPNGVLDSSFGGDGRCEVAFDLSDPEDSDSLAALALQSDGKIVAAGTVQTGNPGNVTDFGVARVLPNCQPDNSFSFDGKAVVHVDAGGNTGDANDGYALLLHGGRPLVVGTAEKNNLDTDFALARLENELIFGDDFDQGHPAAWSQAFP